MANFRRRISYKSTDRSQTNNSPENRSHLSRRTTPRTLLVLAVSTALFVGISATAAWGQTPNPIESLPPQIRNLERDLTGFSGLLTPSSSSEIAKGAVRLDGRKIFTIAVPVIGDRNNSSDRQTPIESRIDIIEERLQRIVDRGFDLTSLKVTSEVDSSSRQPIIYVTSEDNNGKTHRDELLTVTALDAEVNGTSLEDWANTLTQTVTDALTTAQQERQPTSLQQQGAIAAGVLVAMIVSSYILRRFQRRLRMERKGLSAQSKNDSQQLAASSDHEEHSPRVTTALLQRQAENQEKRGVNDIKRRLSQLGQLAVWGGGFFLLVGLFPYTRWLQPLMIGWVQIPIRILGVAIITYLVVRFSAVLIDRLFSTLQNSTSLTPLTSQRLVLRFTTLSRVAKSILFLVGGGIGILAAVSILGVQISPTLLTVAGIIGVGFSLASQNLIKDIINGFLILFEDQYGVGDVIVVGEVSGLVENMNLRITQLRNEEGRLITIPNSSITVVQNLSMEWSRVDLSVSVAYGADLDQALKVTERVAQDMSHDPDWQNLILEPPALLGVDKLDSTGATIRLWIKTQPLKQWEVAREYRRRIKLAFDQAGIPIGVPQQSLWFGNPPDLKHENAPDLKSRAIRDSKPVHNTWEYPKR